MNVYRTQQDSGGFDGLLLVALGLVAFMGYTILKDINVPVSGVAAREATTSDAGLSDSSAETGSGRVVVSEPNTGSNPINFETIAAPYENYTITQGPHGASYGHMAIDLAAGKGKPIKSPITGQVTALFVDQYGNPTLVIENEYYQVTLLHGKYTVEVGQQLKIGQKVGKESNLGYTTDMAGQPCWNRECGYHTHLNIFDKRIGANINPLDVIGN
jgi:murein DD-endopeptidase MepM/ murein hydrolase activator NlpD